MAGSTAYLRRRDEIERYFDRTAFDRWATLTTDAPVSRIRATVREGRDAMRALLLSWLPTDLRGQRVLDAGCGTGITATCLAERGAEVVAVDLSPSLIELAVSRHEPPAAGSVCFHSGDMLADDLGTFDHVIAMDSLIHYDTGDVLAALSKLAPRVSG
ncbi:MAG: magnesium protoporphyrin IX methyltransferase, partial [Pseudomonadota bacterium]